VGLYGTTVYQIHMLENELVGGGSVEFSSDRFLYKRRP